MLTVRFSDPHKHWREEKCVQNQSPLGIHVIMGILSTIHRNVRSERGFTIRQSDVLDTLPALPCDHFGGCLTDPPYELGFMGRTWDSSGIAFNVDLWSEVYRVLKPGAYLLAFGHPRTYHRLTCAIEDAGFEIRDCLKWLYGTGFPKSKATLKSGYEPIVLARKPVGKILPLNIEGCRINPGELVQGAGGNFDGWRRLEGRGSTWNPSTWKPHTKGRYPTNVIVDERVAKILGEKGNFYYCPKASQAERNAGLEHLPRKSSYMVENGSKRSTAHHNNHPCVKPLELTKWLATLIRTEGTSLLVPFSGSGSEMIGGLLAGWEHVVGIELDPDYAKIARARICAIEETQATSQKTQAFAIYGRCGGSSTSAAKRAAARMNGRKGGRPRKSAANAQVSRVTMG